MKKALFYYSVFLSFFITIGTATISFRSGQILSFILFLPITIYLFLTFFKFKKGRKLLLFYNFILITIMSIMGFVGISSAPQLASAILFLPMALYFWLLVLPKKNKKLPIPDRALAIQSTNTKVGKITKGKIKEIEGEIIEEEKSSRKFDVDRRMFLKLIGSTGLMVFMFSIFSKKAEGAFFGSVPGPGTVAIKDTTGAQIDPAIKTPTDGYKITQLDDSSDAPNTYYGFVNKDGAWFIMKDDGSGNYRYTKGSSDFTNGTTGWPNRTGLSYDYFNAIFS